MIDSPILFLIFNRPETEAKVFEAIRKVKPRYLYIAADGPRKTRAGDAEKCKAARDLVDNGIDWECRVKKLYRSENLGCKRAVSSAIDWFFKNVEEGIILEDDCLPDASFFDFCGEMLSKYRKNNLVMHISGDNYLNGKIKIKDDYYFSCFSHVWGWATWKRAWNKYDVDMKDYPVFIKSKKMDELWRSFWTKRYWRLIFEKTYSGKIDTWDYQWLFSIWNYGGLAICPRVNLVQNIGFDIDSTHTTKDNEIVAQLAESLKVRKYPRETIRNIEADNYVFKHNFDASLMEKLVYFMTHR